MSQLGYIVTAIALMSHLGWVTALYLVANHMMVKGILFLAVAGIILRTGTRSFAETGGLRHAMPITFVTVLVAVMSMSGLPPLMGFGGKWLLLSAMTDKGWYLLAAGRAVRHFPRLPLHDPPGRRPVLRRAEPPRSVRLREAPSCCCLPQALLVVGIFVLSFFPKLLMEPVSAAIDPQFASTLVWEGMSLETIYGYWNPMPVAVVALAAAAGLFALFWLIYRRAKAGAADRRGSIPTIVRSSPRRFLRWRSGVWQGVERGTLADRSIDAKDLQWRRADLCTACPLLFPCHISDQRDGAGSLIRRKTVSHFSRNFSKLAKWPGRSRAVPLGAASFKPGDIERWQEDQGQHGSDQRDRP